MSHPRGSGLAGVRSRCPCGTRTATSSPLWARPSPTNARYKARNCTVYSRAQSPSGAPPGAAARPTGAAVHGRRGVLGANRAAGAACPAGVTFAADSRRRTNRSHGNGRGATSLRDFGIRNDPLAPGHRGKPCENVGALSLEKQSVMVNIGVPRSRSKPASIQGKAAGPNRECMVERSEVINLGFILRGT